MIMNWIIPMAGQGIRTRKLGEFKPFIDIFGRTILEWLLISIQGKVDSSAHFIFITTMDYDKRFRVRKRLEDIIKRTVSVSFELITCDGIPPGPAATVYNAKDKIYNSTDPVIVVNCDQYINFGSIKNFEEKSGFLPVYAEFGQKSSYVEIKNGLIAKIVEKNNISNLASAGVYAISEGRALIRAIEKQFRDKVMYKGEFYVGNALNYLISEGYKLYPTPIQAKYDLGSIKDIELFKQHLLTVKMANKWR